MKNKFTLAILLASVILTSCNKKMAKGVVENIIVKDEVLESTYRSFRRKTDFY